MQPNLEKISETIQQFFGVQVESIARRTKFVQRRSKLTGCVFLASIVFSILEKREMTLSSLAQSCLDVGVEITEQGLDRRINAGSQAFLEEMWTLSLEHFRQTEPLAIKLLNQFSGVYLVDSSQISLPANMSELFPGSGGNASTASMKVQLVFDYLRGQFKQLELTHGRAPDQGYRGHWNVLEKRRTLHHGPRILCARDVPGNQCNRRLLPFSTASADCAHRSRRRANCPGRLAGKPV